MNCRPYIAWVVALLMSAATFAASKMSTITYLEYKCREGVVDTHYVFEYDQKGTPWLLQVDENDSATSPRKKASKAFIRDLQALIEQGDVFSYAPEYYAEPEVCGGTKWELEVRLKDGRSVRSSGRAVEPPNSILDSLALLLRSYMAK